MKKIISLLLLMVLCEGASFAATQKDDAIILLPHPKANYNTAKEQDTAKVDRTKHIDLDDSSKPFNPMPDSIFNPMGSVINTLNTINGGVNGPQY